MDSEGPQPSHPAHVHAGTFADLGDVVYPLDNATAQEIPVTVNDSEAAEPTEGPESTPGVTGESAEGENFAQSTTEIEASLDDILASEHAINVHESEENVSTYIACDDISGEPSEGTLIIDLKELNDSGYSGEATLVDNDDGSTSIIIVVSETETSGTPAATP